VDRKLKRYLLVRTKPHKLRYGLLKGLKVKMVERIAKRVYEFFNSLFVYDLLPRELRADLYLLRGVKFIQPFDIFKFNYAAFIKLKFLFTS